MKLKDIVNREIVNLVNCESEPIHIPGSIQPHGFLLGLNLNTHEIIYCSENVNKFAPTTYNKLIGRDLSALFDPEQNKILITYLKDSKEFNGLPVIVILNEKKFECIAHISENTLVLEFEPAVAYPEDYNELYRQTRQFINYIERSETLQDLCQSVAEEIRTITGYDRVMIYRFDEQYNGEVFAESCNDSIEPFLGLHYPHTDIPVQARELYIKNHMRLIVDVAYTPVPIFTIDDGSKRNLDMSHAHLRSVSPIHIQYLKNMGVGATLTLSLVLDKKLWGLIACHHYSPKNLSNHVKISARLQGHFLTSQIKVREAGEEYIVSKEIDSKLQSLLQNNSILTGPTFGRLARKQELLEICHATGVVIQIDKRLFVGGKVPPEKDIQDLAKWLHIKFPGHEFHTDKLAEVYENGAEIADTASGIIYHSLGSNSDAIIWFRHEVQKEVTWGGNPDKAILRDERGLHPRRSFDLWKQSVKGRSNPWLIPEIQAASGFAHSLQRQLHLIMITDEELKYRELSVKLQRANDELENINWISTHDLKEPLRKIQVFASRILDEKEEPIAGSSAFMISRMKEAASRMQTLISDILSYSRLLKNKDAFEPVDLNTILDEIMKELSDEVEEKQAEIEVDELPTVMGIPFMLIQLFINLLRNSLKFTNAGVRSVIKIKCFSGIHPKPSAGLFHNHPYYEIMVSDNGIGIPEEQREKIFNVFTKLHVKEKYPGTGVGLALCRKIMTNHKGAILAGGVEGQGAIFSIYFPPIEYFDANALE